MNPEKKTASFSRVVPDGDTLHRDVCDTCGFIRYENPKVVAGAVVSYEGRILLCRRAIPPRHGLLDLARRIHELNETVEERRSARPSRRPVPGSNSTLCSRSIRSRASAQIQVMYRAALVDPAIEAGAESLEVGLFEWTTSLERDRVPERALGADPAPPDPRSRTVRPVQQSGRRNRRLSAGATAPGRIGTAIPDGRLSRLQVRSRRISASTPSSRRRTPW